jgi:hypothetical protein
MTPTTAPSTPTPIPVSVLPVSGSGSRGYSLLRSKTFWTLVFMCLGNVVTVFKPMLTPDQVTLANLGLTVLASYFHQLTGNSTTGTN